MLAVILYLVILALRYLWIRLMGIDSFREEGTAIERLIGALSGVHGTSPRHGLLTAFNIAWHGFPFRNTMILWQPL